MPNQPKTTGRNVRVADELWDKALAAAEKRGETRADIIRRALEQYVAETNQISEGK